jgi:hypothetical protein
MSASEHRFSARLSKTSTSKQKRRPLILEPQPAADLEPQPATDLR